MVVTPNSRIRLLKCHIEMDNENQLTFANLTAQTNYFLGLTYLEEDNCTYVRKDGVIRFETDPNGITYEDLLRYNYVMYQNTSYENKWFYAFITKIKYDNDGMTEISIETDTFQTWQFNIVYKRTFVEREHVINDTLGLHTIPEGLELGDYVINAHLRDSHLRDPKIVIASTVTPSEGTSLIGAIYDGIYSGIRYYTYDAATVTTNLQYLANNSKIDAVTCLFLAPDFLIPQTGGGAVNESSSYKTYDLGVSPIATLNNYTPVNQKMLTYPYCYILASNGQGASAVYYQELFTAKNTSNEYVFRVKGSLTPGCSIRMYPVNYKGSEDNIDEGITLGKYPQLNWATDMFTNWVTQNGVNVATNLVGNTALTVGSAMTGNVAGGITGISGVANALNEVYKATLIPPQSYGNINSGDIMTSAQENTFHVYRMTIKQEYAKIIDHFFSMYGYKVNDVKLPNITGRTNWNFVKTINCNIEGEIPQEDIQKIKEIFNNGVTLWHNPSTFLDYSQSNTIVS